MGSTEEYHSTFESLRQITESILASKEPTKEHLHDIQRVLADLQKLQEKLETKQQGSVEKERELAGFIENKQVYTDIVEMAKSFIVQTDSKGTITFINNFALNFFGYRRDELLGQQIVGTLIPEKETTGRNLVDLVSSALENPTTHTTLEHENCRADGSRIWVHWENRVITDAQGNFVGMLGVGQDVTKRKQAEEMLKRDKETLERMVEERTGELMRIQREMDRSKRLSDLGRLSSSIAHELRRPLAALKLSLYNIRKKRKNPEIDTHLDHCDEKCFEAEQIINKILDSSTLKSPKFQKTDLHKLITYCIDYVESMYTEDHIKVVRQLDPLYGVQAQVDPYQIREVIYNLLQNACEALAGDSGSITVEGFIKEQAVGFQVKDNNGGVPESEIEKLKEPYYTTKHRGFGLGLTLSQEMIKQHGGTLHIESTPGMGTAVIVTLPQE
ncbi:MAG: PAS domain S-box protein [Spirochaetia bacterium]|nr:PAS domain S-box protein [Spirochaetia bacterium]